MERLTPTMLEESLKTLPEWKLDSGKIVRSWKFKDFVGAMAFVNRVAAAAETAGHHPDIDIRYNQVLLGLVSHDAGGITSKDIQMASTLNSLSDGRTSQASAE